MRLKRKKSSKARRLVGRTAPPTYGTYLGKEYFLNAITRALSFGRKNNGFAEAADILAEALLHQEIDIIQLNQAIQQCKDLAWIDGEKNPRFEEVTNYARTFVIMMKMKKTSLGDFISG